MDIYGGTLHLISGKEIALPDAKAVQAVMDFWESVPVNDDIPTAVEIGPTLDIILQRSSIMAIERVGSLVHEKPKR
jgi:hypothetical protein